MKFVHAADLHLDSPLRGLERYDGCPYDAIRGASRRALENLVRLAIDERVELVLLAGDQFDGAGKDYRSALYFVQQMRRLHEAGIRVVAIHGNHDALCKMTRTLTPPPSFAFLPVDQPGSIAFDDLGVVVHGQGFARPAVHENLSLAYPPAVGGAFNIGMLHTSLQYSGEHDPYARCTIADLARKGYDYWALGHIHKRSFESTEVGGPPIVFPGNVQGRHARETGPKGCILVTVERGAAACEFRALDVFRWERCAVSIDGAATADDAVAAVLERIAEARADAKDMPMAARVELTGSGPAHHALLGNPTRWSEQIRADAPPDVWIEKVQFHCQPTQATEPVDDDLLLEVRAALADNGPASKWRRQLKDELLKLQRELPADAQADATFRPDDDAWLDQLVAESTALLGARLHQMGGPAP